MKGFFSTLLGEKSPDEDQSLNSSEKKQPRDPPREAGPSTGSYRCDDDSKLSRAPPEENEFKSNPSEGAIGNEEQETTKNARPPLETPSEAAPNGPHDTVCIPSPRKSSRKRKASLNVSEPVRTSKRLSAKGRTFFGSPRAQVRRIQARRFTGPAVSMPLFLKRNMRKEPKGFYVFHDVKPRVSVRAPINEDGTPSVRDLMSEALAAGILSPDDVLEGRGEVIDNFPGNVKIRKWIKQRVGNDYRRAATQDKKDFVIRSLIKHFSFTSGRFVRLEPGGAVVVLTDDEALVFLQAKLKADVAGKKKPYVFIVLCCPCHFAFE